MLFEGAFSALPTPFTEKNQINFESLEKLINFQLENGISGFVPCGTTGESPTLSFAEKEEVIKKTIEFSAGKVPIIAGTGNYDTKATIEATKKAATFGAKGALVITPYYNKPTQKGLYYHFSEVAKANPNIDIVIYNVPSRTNLNISPEIVEKLVEKFENITTIKEASGDISQILELQRRMGDRLTILSGEDGLIWPYIAAGGKGVVSVVSNIRPKETSEIVKLGLAGKSAEALEAQQKLNPLVNALFTESNPIPVKFALNKIGFNFGTLRAPLHDHSEEFQEKLIELLA
jgi:4-hydroxy-tetrahydrodipicolinate synthase